MSLDPELLCPCYDNIDYKNTRYSELCALCHSYQHRDCVKGLEKMKEYVCPSCQIRTGGVFYNRLFSILEPCLFSVSKDNKINKKRFVFIPEIKDYKECAVSNVKCLDDPVVILIRSLRLEEKGYSFHWPKMSKIYINNKLALDLTLKGTKKLDRTIALIFKKDVSIDANKTLKLYDSHMFCIEDILIDSRPNYITIDIDDSIKDLEENCNYVISADFCEILKDASLIIEKVPKFMDKELIRSMICEQTKDSNFNGETVNLIDLYSEERIELPARGKNCTHLGVFDLKTFLNGNRKSNRYICEQCKKLANDFYIDGNILEFMEKPGNEDVIEIVFDKDLNITASKRRDEEN